MLAIVSGSSLAGLQRRSFKQGANYTADCSKLRCPSRRRTPPRNIKVHLSTLLQNDAAQAPGSGPGTDMSESLTLENIRQALIRQEDTIIFSLIERAMFARNALVYEPGAIPVPGFGRDGKQYSLLEYMLREQEQLHGKIRRYTSPDEHAFFPDDLPGLVLPPIEYPEVLAPGAKSININDSILPLYLDVLLPGITQPGDDNNYGSAAMYDVLALQALSKRIHYGKFVAEAKFRAQPDKYSELIRAADAGGLMDLLTDRAVEHKVVDRVRLKAATFGQDLQAGASAGAGGGDGAGNGAPPRYKVQPDTVASLYDKWVMPLTKDVQVAYLLRRLDAQPQQQ